MTDDMVTLGRQIPSRDEAIAALFSACYPQLVATGYAVAGDWAVAEELAQEAFVRLSPRKRACVVLRYLADMTEAQTLGITPGTVKSQTHKALRQLRQQLAEPAEAAEPAIDPATGRITRAFTYAEAANTNYDFWDLNATVGQGSIWVLAPLGHNEVVRVSMTTGRPLSIVYPGGSCRQYCSQIYDTAGAVWEPTSHQIVRIDPARMN